MVLKILLGITIAFHFAAVYIAIRLTRVTKFNLSWMLISAALVIMAVRLLVEILPFVSEFKAQDLHLLFVWLGIASSLFLVIGVFLIQKIFKYTRLVEQRTREYEKRLLTAVIETEERERKRFAGDLHDGLGPLLSSIKLSLSSLTPETPDRHRAKVLANVDMLVNEGIRSIKEISDNLSPHVLSNFGVEKALRNFINKVQMSGQIKIATDFNLHDRRFASNIETVVFRVACELIHNTCKHSGADKAWCGLNVDGQLLVLTYGDNGKGMDLREVMGDREHNGIGFYSIFSRVESLKGNVRFDEEVEKGIFVTIEIPINEANS